MAEYCLCQRVKKEVFSSEKDFTDAVMAHHAVMQAAMKAKQNVDPSFADALDHAVGTMSQMYLRRLGSDRAGMSAADSSSLTPTRSSLRARL